MIGEKEKKVPSWSKSEWHGFLLIHKEVGPTSHDTVNGLRNILTYRKIGHTGTLDPAACGLLLTCLGRGCKIVQFLNQWDKEYRATIKLGEETDTYDAQGKIIKVTDNLNLDEDKIEKAILSFKGEQWQLSPSYAAVKFEGKKLYEYAREGKDVPKKMKRIKIKHVQVEKIDLPFVNIKVTCSSGTYIRSLAYDIGKKLGCGAYLFSLCRTRVGPFELKEALSLERVKKEKDKISDFFVKIENVLKYLPSLVIKDHFKEGIKNGVDLKPAHIDSVEKYFNKGDKIVLKDESGEILAIGDSFVSSEKLFDNQNQKKIFKYRRVLF
ncbi:MAG: tRNA pseudouridine(55) synthase TruB [Candidatus Zixiibacteriota bacterium]